MANSFSGSSRDSDYGQGRMYEALFRGGETDTEGQVFRSLDDALARVKW